MLDKSNSMSRVVQVEADLPGHPLAAQYFIEKHNKKLFGRENEGQGHKVRQSQLLHSMSNTSV